MVWYRTIIMDKIQNTTETLPPGCWRFSGFIGERLDRTAAARFTAEGAWDQYYPQTEEAFRRREDDVSHAPRGVWRGEFWGKYILGAIAACQYYDCNDLKKRIQSAAAGLIQTQDENGYIGTYADSKKYHPNTWNIWCRKYTLWGLLEAWHLLGDDGILQAAARFMDHLMTELGPDGDDIIQTGQFKGLPSTSILKPVVDLYRAVGEARYLDFAGYIVEQWSAHPDGPPDILNKALEGKPVHEWFDAPQSWAKSYEFISCAEGLVELYRVTGTSNYLKAAENLHQVLREWERNPAGGISFNDKFVGSRFLINSVAEICDMVYWNRFSLQLFELTGKTVYMDEIERPLYNALMGAMNITGEWGLRRFRLTHVHIPAHRHFLKGHQCCVDNLPRGLFQAAQSAVLRDPDGVRVALYEPGTGSFRMASGNTLTMSLSGDFLNDEPVLIVLEPEAPERFILRLRMPYWSNHTEIQVNGETVSPETRDNWCSIQRTWRSGDTVCLTFCLSVRFEYVDPSVFSDTDDLVKWNKKEWARLALMGEDNTSSPDTNVTPLSPEDALPQKRSAMAFQGPLALARDIRLGDSDPFSRVPSIDQRPTLTPADPPENIRRAFTLTFADGTRIPVCDFGSAGNTWDDSSRFSAWLRSEQQEKING